MDEWFEPDLFEAAATWISGALSDYSAPRKQTRRRFKQVRRNWFKQKEDEELEAKIRAAKRKK